MYPYTLPLLLLALLMGGSGQASNLMREQRIAAEITRGPVGGELLWPQAGQTRFLAIHSPATTRKTLGGVILLHDMGGHPDRAGVIRPLRLYLPTRGWDCLSIQLPVAARGADAQAYRPLIPQAAARIQAAIDYFKGRNDRNLILLGHGLGARMALESLARRQPKEVRALVAIGLPTPPRQADNPVTRAMAGRPAGRPRLSAGAGSRGGPQLQRPAARAAAAGSRLAETGRRPGDHGPTAIN